MNGRPGDDWPEQALLTAERSQTPDFLIILGPWALSNVDPIHEIGFSSRVAFLYPWGLVSG
eukprot:4946980-Pyramimonas_sp.AAC.1